MFEDFSTECVVNQALCPGCGEPLNQIQPFESDPDRLLGTCEGCLAMFHLIFVGNTPILLPVESAIETCEV